MAEDRKTFTADQLFTRAELDKASRIVRVAKRSVSAVDQLEAEVVKPAMRRIDRLTGQENSPRYFAYLLFHLLT